MTDKPDQRPAFNPLARRSWTDLGPRVISGGILIVVAVAALYVGSYLFAALVAAAFAGCYREWEQMVTLKPLSSIGWALLALIALVPIAAVAFGLWAGPIVVAAAVVVALFGRPEVRAWRIGGIVFYGAVILALIAIRGAAAWYLTGLPDLGFWTGLLLAAVIWATDTGAYFTGRQVGGEKLAPDISPSKTWSGAIGGFACGTLIGLVLWLLVVPASPWWIGLLLSAALSIAGQVGDLSESAIKRRFRVKDSGDIIPGHGGLMDRLDSTTFGALFLLLVGLLHAGSGTIAAGFLVW